MNNLKFVQGYKADEPYGKSLTGLANLIFGINLNKWDNRYIPFSYMDGEAVAANVSINLLDLIIRGERRSALQIGTVMTHPDYRKRGLSARLMNRVLDEYGDKCDYIYLFANRNVLDFYPRFGFEPVEEHQFTLDYSAGPKKGNGIRKLDMNNSEHVRFLAHFTSERIPVSRRFGTDRAHGILMFYCRNVFTNDIYYLEQEDVTAIFQRKEGRIDLYDLIGRREINLEAILAQISDEDTQEIVFHYTPDDQGMGITSRLFTGDEVLFVKANGNNRWPENCKHPLTSQA